jgi:hypothetical protein
MTSLVRPQSPAHQQARMMMAANATRESQWIRVGHDRVYCGDLTEQTCP